MRFQINSALTILSAFFLMKRRLLYWNVNAERNLTMVDMQYLYRFVFSEVDAEYFLSIECIRKNERKNLRLILRLERFGTGVKRINNSYANSEIEPQFGVYDNSIKVTLPVVRMKTSLSEDERLVYQNLTGSKMMTSTEIAAMTGFGKTKVVGLLKLLVEQGYVKQVGSGRGTKYMT